MSQSQTADVQTADVKHTDVLIIGAGISGISSAFHLKKHSPKASFEILEQRDSIGGTWNLFKYPGVRSDSDMYTLGFSFRPWKQAKAIADAPAIMDYLKGAVSDGKLDETIQFGKKVVQAKWSTPDSKWFVTIEDKATGAQHIQSCKFLHSCAGYYNYDHGYQPDFPGADNFKGEIVHPQFWPEGLDYKGKKVVVIGSGATAVTLVPAMARDAADVKMLQRSPTYIVARPAEDGFANFTRKFLPAMMAYGLTRWKNVLMGRFFFWMCRKYPDAVKKRLLDELPELLPEGFDIEKHLTPKYDPWDQRVCLAPDGDFFTSIRKGKADIVTDHIERFTEAGIELKSGETLEADVVVSATGLDLNFLGNIEVSVDGEAVEPGNLLNYKGMMYSGIPNLVASFGYTNASWTLRCDLTSRYLARMINYMDRKNLGRAMPTPDMANVEFEPLLDFSSGYITRKSAELPKQGSIKPWVMYQNYIADIFLVKFGALRDSGLKFTK